MPSNFEIFKHFTKGVHVIFCLSSRHNFQNYPASYPSKWTNPSPAKCFILHPTIKISVIPHPASKPVLDTPLYISHDVQYLSLNVIKHEKSLANTIPAIVFLYSDLNLQYSNLNFFALHPSSLLNELGKVSLQRPESWRPICWIVRDLYRSQNFLKLRVVLSKLKLTERNSTHLLWVTIRERPFQSKWFKLPKGRVGGRVGGYPYSKKTTLPQSAITPCKSKIILLIYTFSLSFVTICLN